MKHGWNVVGRRGRKKFSPTLKTEQLWIGKALVMISLILEVNLWKFHYSTKSWMSIIDCFYMKTYRNLLTILVFLFSFSHFPVDLFDPFSNKNSFGALVVQQSLPATAALLCTWRIIVLGDLFFFLHLHSNRSFLM